MSDTFYPRPPGVSADSWQYIREEYDFLLDVIYAIANRPIPLAEKQDQIKYAIDINLNRGSQTYNSFMVWVEHILYNCYNPEIASTLPKKPLTRNIVVCKNA
jgi:hypothetical protein